MSDKYRVKAAGLASLAPIPERKIELHRAHNPHTPHDSMLIGLSNQDTLLCLSYMLPIYFHFCLKDGECKTQGHSLPSSTTLVFSN